jgi:hypothetical protein
MKIRTGVRSDGIHMNRCEKVLKVRTGVRAGGYRLNRCEGIRFPAGSLVGRPPLSRPLVLPTG